MHMNKIYLFIIIVLFSAGCKNGPVNNEVQSPLPAPSQQSLNENIKKSADPIGTSNALPDSVVNKLTGKWIRSDGGYRIEVFSVTKDGKMDAGYFNPNPIHVDKAEWKISEDKLYMRVILKDVNYPGSTYVLVYNPDKDNLSGNYFQAVEKTNYDVDFSRMK